MFLLLIYQYTPNLNLPLAYVLSGTITGSILWQLITYGLVLFNRYYIYGRCDY